LKGENDKLLLSRKSIINEGFLDLPQETQVINRNIELEKKIKQMESDSLKHKSRDESSIS
jgi:hypothetical protein